MIYAEILAGGKGTRMGNTALPKQFLNLGGMPIIIQTTSKSLLQPFFSGILIVVPNQWMRYTSDLFKKFFSEDELRKISIVKGGNNRNQTLMNGVDFIENNFGLNDEDIIVTHDAVRPFVSSKIIEENVKAAKKYGAADTVITATDTIVEGNLANDLIKSIPDRKKMYQGQTPQTLNIKKLKSGYAKLSEDQKSILTDAAKIFLLTDTSSVKMVEGESINFKITKIFDLKMAELLVGER
ncbi:IspD/TarI family cytidylyltransferase [Levilactobacillus brevis]|uniref:IspD/TarI family cytidylyltransferase n=1 Tax=Levilactobacillus brevis TaxID=1580 RepID=UPI001BDE6928|nr:2-C-methyl-D-erythritol 4-phosphate cytidylyltransferase [Levilactobacillus brevis]